MRNINDAFGGRRNTFIASMFALVIIVIGWAAAPTGQVQKVSGSNGGSVANRPVQADADAAAASSAVCTMPPAGMLNWYTADGYAGDIQGGRNGTLRGGATFAPGKVLQAFSLDGQNDFVDVGDLDLSATFTIDAWINPSSFINPAPYILNKDDGIQRSYFFSLNGGKLRAVVRNTNGGQNFTQYQTINPVVVTGSWQFVAVTYNGSAPLGQKMRFYLNGANIPAEVLFNHDIGGTPENNSLPAKIGIEGNGANAPFAGLIDELETFNRVLSPAELLAIFTADSDGKCKTGIPTPTPQICPISPPGESFPAGEGPSPTPPPFCPTPTPATTPTPTPTPTPEPCAFDLSFTSRDFPVEGGAGILNLEQTSTGPKCEWFALERTSGDPFVTVLTRSGRGTGSVTFRVDPSSAMTGSTGRSAIFDFIVGSTGARQPITINQAVDGCTFRLSPADRFVSRGSGSFTVEITAPDGCQWNAGPRHNWLTISGNAFGVGSGIIRYQVQANSDASFRTGVIRIAGLTHVVNQASRAGCPIDFLAERPVSPFDKRPGEINQFHGFRDEVLTKTPRGRKYSEDYYLFAGEITKIMIFNPTLFFRSKDVLERYAPIVESVLVRERAKRFESPLQGASRPSKWPPEGGTQNISGLEPTIVYDSEIDDVTELLGAFSAQATGSLRETLDRLRRDIRDPQVQAEFGVQVIKGERRPLPDEKPGIIGSLSLFDFGSGLEFLNPFSTTPEGEMAGR